jgi:hypothetical protein
VSRDWTSDAFVAKFDPRGNGAESLVYSTYLGGTDEDFGGGIAVDQAGNVYVSGSTMSTDFPTTADAYQPASRGFSDNFVTILSPGAAGVAYSSYLGGSNQDGLSHGLVQPARVVIDAAGSVYLAGTTNSPDFPTTANAFQPARLSPSWNWAGSITKFTFAAPQPDLKVTLTATVVNAGGANAPSSVTRFVADGVTVLGVVETPPIPSGGSTSVSIDWRTAGVQGAHAIEAVADAAQQVAESDETNNARSVTLEVQGNQTSR